MSTPHPSLATFTAMKDEITGWRHDLHRHPELAYEEHWTSDFIAAKLESFGYTPARGIGGTGVVATLDRGEGPSIGLRADMDALPMEERTNLAFASTRPGKMHACGHDGHVTMLLAAARHLAATDGPPGKIRFIFQPAEEGEAGAAAMIRDGLFRDHPVDAVYGMHNWPGLPEGSFTARPGPQMAAFDVFEVVIEGQGGHAAMPHRGQDVLTAAAALQSQAQSIVARMIDPLEPAVVSITEFHGGSTWNVLPGSVRLAGCTRHMTKATQDRIEQGLGDLCAGIARGFGVSVNLTYDRRYPATVNTAAEVAIALDAARTATDGQVTDSIPPTMASEDFSFMLEERPGCFIWLGAGSTEGGNTLHSETYRFNDAILPVGAAYWVALTDHALTA